MASKKGIVLTAVVLSVITATSFLIWFIPQPAVITVSDYGEYLDRIQQINRAITDDVEITFEMLLSGDIDPDTYIETIESSSTLLRSELIQLTRVEIPEQWSQSYQMQIDSMMTSIKYMRETITVAEKIGDGDDMYDAIEDVKELLKRADQANVESNAVRPDT